MTETPLPDRLAMISFFVSGTAALTFGLFSVLGTITGVGLSALAIASREEEMLVMGPLLAIAYGLWMVVCLATGGLHFFAGYKLAQRHEKGTWLIVASLGGLSLGLTVYCAPFGIFSAAMGLWALLHDRDQRKGS